MKTIWMAIGMLGLMGCASRHPINCDWRLQPINPPPSQQPVAKTSTDDSKDESKTHETDQTGKTPQ